MAGVEFTNNFRLVEGELTEEMRQRVRRAALVLEAEVKRKILRGERTGRQYFVPGTGAVRKVIVRDIHGRLRAVRKREGAAIHTASAPGEAPANLFGNLAGSITHEFEDTATLSRGVVGTNVEYARRLEFGFIGTDSLGRRYNMAERPYFRAAYEENRERLMQILHGGGDQDA